MSDGYRMFQHAALDCPVMEVPDLLVWSTSDESSPERPTEVRIIAAGHDLPAAMGVVFRSREGLERVIKSLQEHAEAVWGEGFGDRPRHQAHGRAS